MIAFKKENLFKYIIILSIVFILLIMIIFKPKYELNKAINYIESGEYSTAYEYINSKSNSKNKRIIKELISQIFIKKASSGIKQIISIANKGTDIINDVKKSKIDYSLDDNLNVQVKALEKYIVLEDEITTNMIIDEISETYDLYFECLMICNENFIDILNKISDKNFINILKDLSDKMEILSIKVTNTGNIYTFLPETTDIYNKIDKYI